MQKRLIKRRQARRSAEGEYGLIADDRHGRLVARLAALAPHDATLEQICRGSVTLLDVSGAAVILMSEEESGARTAAFGARVAEVEDLQFALGEGPCLEAFRG